MTIHDYFVIGTVVTTLVCVALLYAFPCKSCKGYYWSQGSETG